MTPILDLVRRVRTALDDASRFSVGASARDADGFPCLRSNTAAVSFDVVSHVYLSCADQDAEIQELVIRAVAPLCDAGIPHLASVMLENDRGIEAARSMVDEAIGRLGG